VLNGCRALDLTDENGFLCGKILADLGVDVIKVERPGGDPSRRTGPFLADTPHPEKNLYWFAYNSNKRGITLNIEANKGKDILRELVKTADFIIESFPPGFMDNLGLGYPALSSIRRGIILTSITPFGQAGPYKDYQTSDIVTMGMSGILYQTGDSDRPPVHMSLPQACLLAGADAAVGTMIAYYHRETTGEGQHVDVSRQQSAAWFLADAIPFWELAGTILKRMGVFRLANKSIQRQVWQCKDGYVFFFMVGGRTGAKTFRELVSWMQSQGMTDEYLETMDWENLDMFRATQEVIDRISKPIEKFFLAHTKREIAQEAVARRISICPLSSMEDLLNDAQLKARNFWVEIEHPELNSKITYPREFVKSSAKVCATRFRAPLIGEHNGEIYGDRAVPKRPSCLKTSRGYLNEREKERLQWPKNSGFRLGCGWSPHHEILR
jgi:crotonobetainyl-CoA:carnitine CoA-transferase CaiB-like acyl-CoA transferase